MTRIERADLLEGTSVAVPRRIVGELAAAFGFLTRLPVGTMPATPGRTGAAAFALAGAAVGAVGAIALVVLGGRAPLAAGAIAVGTMAVVSGVLHLDGLADTADALAAPTSAASIRARKDPAVGPAGVVAIAIVLLTDVGLLSTLAGATDGPSAIAGPFRAALACVVAASGSRALPVLAVVVLRGPAGDGLGGWFASRTGPGSALLAVASALAVAVGASVVAGQPSFVLGVVGGIVVGLLVAAWLASARRGLDGDALGAIVEVGFATILVIVVVAS